MDGVSNGGVTLNRGARCRSGIPSGTKGGIRRVGGIYSIAPSGGDLELDAAGLDRQNRRRPFTQRLTDEGEIRFTQ